MDRLELARPDDWHLHLRDGAALAAVLPHTARQFARAIVMPNLKPPVTTVALATAYRDRILAALPAGLRFEPLMTLYLTDATAPDEVRRAKDSGFIHGIKLYPAGATTNSAAGVTNLRNAWPALETMQAVGMPLLVHGEVTDPAVDLFDRERVFIDEQLIPLRAAFPSLRVVFEHITTKDAADYVHDCCGRERTLAATLTAHHLLYNRNALFVGGIRPHWYCLPVPQARGPSPGARRRRDVGQALLLPRHRQRAPCARREGERVRLRGLLHRAARAGAVRRSVRSRRSPRSARRLRELVRGGLLRSRAQHRSHRIVEIRVDHPRQRRVRRRTHRAARCRRHVALQARERRAAPQRRAAPSLSHPYLPQVATALRCCSTRPTASLTSI